MPSSPLEGVRVIDLTRLLPGNYCCWILSSLGAEVVKVEDPGAGDYMRDIGRKVDGQSGVHHLVNRGKRSIVLDLKNPSGRDAFLRLAATADVVVESFRSGVLDRLGIGPDVLREVNPAIVVASISGYGATGPLSGVAAHDINALGFAGILHMLTRNPDGVPEAPALPIADLIGGSLLPAIGILALIQQARRTGRGGWLDGALAEGVALLPSVVVGDILAGMDPPPAGTPESPGTASYRVYELIDGQVCVGSVEPQFWRGLCDAIGLSELIPRQSDPAAQPELERALTARFATMTRADFTSLTEGKDTCATLVNDFTDMIATPHARARGLTRPAPDVDMDVLAPPFCIDGERPPETVGAPRQGQHTQEVLTDWGFTAKEIAALVASGAAGLPDGHRGAAR